MKFDSFWKPYIDILPTSYDNFPLFYTEELKQLKGSFVVEVILSRKLSLEEEFKNIQKHLPVFGKKITFDEYRWATIAVTSRTYGVTINKKINDSIIVPMADMFNHINVPSAIWNFNDEKKSFVVTSDTLMKTGDEVFESYGLKSNSQFLVNYGFTLENNEYMNSAVLFIKPTDLLDIKKAKDEKERTFINKKISFLTKNNCTIDDSLCNYMYLIKNNKEVKVSKENYFRFKFNIFFPNTKTNNLSLSIIKSLFGFLRLIHSTSLKQLDKQFDNVKNIREIFSGYEPMTIEVELKVLETLSLYCKKALSNFDSDIMSDIKERNNTKRYSTRWNILNLLIGEKKTLLYYKELGENICSIWSKTKNHDVVSSYLKIEKIYYPYYELYWKKLSTSS